MSCKRASKIEQSHVGCRCYLGFDGSENKISFRGYDFSSPYHAVVKQFLKFSPRIKYSQAQNAMGACQGVVQNSFFPPYRSFI